VVVEWRMMKWRAMMRRVVFRVDLHGPMAEERSSSEVLPKQVERWKV